MPDPCDGFDRSTCVAQPWHPCCDPCGPPGGALDPNNKLALGSSATFYGWENGHSYAARIDSITPDELFAAATIFIPGAGEYFYPSLPLVNKKHADAELRSVKAYLEERSEFLEILNRHMAAFGAEWLASGNQTPRPAFSRFGNRVGEFLPPFKEGLDCLALVIKEVSPGIVDLKLEYSTGRGWSIQRGVEVLNAEQIEAARAQRRLYVQMWQPHWDAALAEWAHHY